jgi:hypothetical protein
MEQESRIDAEWVAINAFREILKLSTKGDLAKATYDDALDFGGELYPALLGKETSILRRDRESDTTKEYRQRARLKSQKENKKIEALELLVTDIEEIEELLQVARKNKDLGRVDQLRNRLKSLSTSRNELAPTPHTENQLIFRDTTAAVQGLPAIDSGKSYRDFRLPDDNVLRIRVLHPDKPEHITGADIIYERHDPYEQSASLIVVQYKIWENKSLKINEPRLAEQLEKMRNFTCESSLCENYLQNEAFRFPYCTAFLRPTDKLQKPDQKFISSGEHIPICKIQACATNNERGNPVIEYKKIRPTSLSGEAFEYLFTANKIGSRKLEYDELERLYEKFKVSASNDQIVIHAQEVVESW